MPASHQHRPGLLRSWRTLTLLVMLALPTIALLWIWIGWEQMRQQKVMTTVLVLLVAAMLLLLWTVLCSGWRWWARATVVIGAAVLVGAAIASVRIRGVSGDLVPVLEWRWGARVSTPAATPAPVRSAGTVPAALDGLADFPQFLGAGRDAVLDGPRLARDWDAQPPVLLWRQPIGAGWSGFAVAGPRAVTQEQSGDDELVACYDLATGAVLWSHADDELYESGLAGTGPRATPTIAGDVVYASGATGLLNALDLETGDELWSVDVLGDNDAKLNEWGMSGSPLVIDDLVVINAGGSRGRSLVAYDRATGVRVWAAGNDGASYASPELVTIDGRPTIVMVNSESVSGHDPSAGEVLWSLAWPGRTPKVAQPVALSDDTLLVTAGYGLGAVAFRVGVDEGGALAPGVLWRSRALKAKFTNVVLHDGFVYGLDDGVLACIDAATGERQWKEGRYGHGQLLLVDDLLLLLAEDGELVLVEPTPEAHRELARFAALDDKTWNTPALAGRYLLVRNDLEAACYRLGVGN